MPRPPGVKLSKEGIVEAQKALTSKGLTHEKLAEIISEKYDLGLTRQPIGRFFNGERIDRSIFSLICQELGLNVVDVIETIPEANTTNGATNRIFPPNPFGDRGKITDGNRFFNRELLFHELWEELGKGGSVSLVGDTQVGKSSILSMIFQKGLERLQKSVIYLDMQIIHNESQFFEELCHILGVEPCCRGSDLKKALGKKRYILCLDEIEKMTRKEHFTGDERTDLRGLADGADTPLTLVIASRSRLDHLFPDSPVKNSPLANICRTIPVKPFSTKVTRDFLNHRLEGTGVQFTDNQMEKLWEKSQGNPGRLQDEAFQLYRFLTLGYSDEFLE